MKTQPNYTGYIVTFQGEPAGYVESDRSQLYLGGYKFAVALFRTRDSAKREAIKTCASMEVHKSVWAKQYKIVPVKRRLLALNSKGEKPT